VGTTIKILTVVGARPNFMKAAPIIRAIEEHNRAGNEPRLENLLVHTGQHYDPLMSQAFFADLGLPTPNVDLGVGSGSPASQTAEILRKLETVLTEECPDIMIVVGDVNSTVAAALAVAKLPVTQGQHRPLIAHVEAGLRSFDREMPEEINRIVTDHLADLLFVTEKSGLVNLRREGIPAERSFFVGNTMIDSLLAFKHRADESRILEKLGLRGHSEQSVAPALSSYALLTLHRPANVDESRTLDSIFEGLSNLAQKMEIIFPVHPRTRNRIEEFGANWHMQGRDGKSRRIRFIDPLGYVDFLCLMKNARIVLTDSGGIQEETTCLGVPCVTIRNNTERPVTVKHGTNVIAGTSPRGIQQAIARQLARRVKPCVPEKWDGKAAERIVTILANSVRREIATEAREDSSCTVDAR
jgi:UDP-N-acetylglucosamine 2-epimerase (non-hydrolysing)